MITNVLFNPDQPFMWILIGFIIIAVMVLLSRPFRTFAAFSYPNAKFEAIGNPFVQENTLQRYTDLSEIQSFIDQLNQQKDYHVKETTAAGLQSELDNHFLKTIQMMKQDSSKKMNAFYDAYIELIDAQLLKTAFKQLVKQDQIDDQLADHAFSSTIAQQLKILSSTTIEDLPEILKQFNYPAHFIDQITKDNTVISLAPLIDAAVDQMMIDRFTKITVPYKCKEAMKQFITRMIDLRSIKHLLRAKHLSLSADQCEQLLIADGYELLLWKQQQLCKEETIADVINALDGTSYHQVLRTIKESNSNDTSVQPLTDALDVYWLQLVKDLSVAHYSSIGPTLRFLEYKKQEIRNLKIISKGIIEHLPSSLITPLLITEGSI